MITNPDGQSGGLKEAFTVQTYIHDPNKLLKPVFFDYNKWDIRNDQLTRLDHNLSILKSNPKLYVSSSDEMTLRFI